ncbi:MAG: hypothetical protein LBH07_01830, partial [Treponema sp.]|nr:hypothetical protein [Treponema sp.]
MAPRFFSTFLIGIILCVSTVNLYTQNNFAIKGFDNRIFEYHFDRADRELDPASWIREARRGLELAIVSWERTALELFADPELRLEAGRELARWSETELEKRYARWLLNRFFGQEHLQMINDLDNAIEEANRLYAYTTDDNGNILYRENGEPLSVRPSEGRSIEEDRILWDRLVAGTAETALQNYQAVLVSSFPEMLFYINRENRKNTETSLNGFFNHSLFNRQAEFEALLAREERLFIARRTGDIWSLRKQSEKESAYEISSRLIRDAENNCTAALASLEEKIEAARAGTGDLALAGEEWLWAFQEQFDKGLRVWAEAEERFIIRRMEWERDSGERFQEGQEAWRTAFAELEKERLLWEAKARDLFNAGEQLFINASEKLAAAIYEAKLEFQKDAALRIYSGTERARALVDMYITCASVLAEAKNSVKFWLDRFIPGAPANGLENGTLAAWVNQTMKQKPLNEYQYTAAVELIRWAGIYTQSQNRAVESLTMLEKEFGLVLGMDDRALNSVLDSSSEDFFLDEYQIELLRAKAIAGYWEQRLAIAEAVSAYAEDLSAGRMTEAESLEEWRNAKTKYDNALSLYAAIHEGLGNAGNNLASIQQELQNASYLLAVEEKKLEELNNRYSLQMAVYMINTNDFILEELGSYYAALIALVEDRQKDTDYYMPYLMAEKKYFEEYVLMDGWVLLKSIVEGTEDTETKQIQLALLSANSGSEWYFS